MGRRILGVLIIVLVLLLSAFVAAIAMNRPMLWDPPGFAKRLSVYMRYNTAETAAEPVLPELRIRRYHRLRGEMKERIEQTIQSLPRWRMVREEAGVGVYQVEVTSPLWRFRDDVFIRVNDLSGGEVEVYLYSASRVGRGDFGANRYHILQFYKALEQKLKQDG